MSIMLTDSGATAVLTEYFGSTTLTVKLFTNDAVISDALVSTDFTEAAGGGYAAKTVAAGASAVSTVGGIVQAAVPQQVYEFTGPLTGNPSVYGYYVVDPSGTLVFADKAAGAYTPSSSGDIYAVTPTFQLSKGTPT